jgi:hypothetical protein
MKKLLIAVLVCTIAGCVVYTPQDVRCFHEGNRSVLRCNKDGCWEAPVPLYRCYRY